MSYLTSKSRPTRTFADEEVYPLVSKKENVLGDQKIKSRTKYTEEDAQFYCVFEVWDSNKPGDHASL